MTLVAATSALPLSGCSFLLFDRPSQYKSREKTTCTTSYALPAVDVGFAVLHLVSIAVLASASGDAFGGEKSRSSLGQLDVFWLIMHGASAGWGFSWAGECRELVGDDAGFGTQPVRATPRPQPRPIAPPAEPAAAPEAPSPQPPRIPQRVDSE